MPDVQLSLISAAVICLGVAGIDFWRHRKIAANRLGKLAGQPEAKAAFLKGESWKKRAPEFKVSVIFFVATASLALLLGLPWHLSLLLVALSGPMSFWLLRRRRLSKIRREFSSFFPESVDSLNRAIQAGVPVERALASMADLYRGEIAKRFRRLVQLLELGVPFREALVSFSQQLDLPDVDFFCAIMALNRESGSRLSPLLTSLSRTLRERQAVERKLKGLTAETRSSARILMLLPIIVIGLQMFINPRHIEFILIDPVGRILLGYVAISMLAGFLIIQRMSSLMEI